MHTHFFTFGFIFGEGISTFPPKKIPTEADVVRRWIYEFDSRFLGQNLRRPGEAFKNEVIYNVVDDLIEFWKNEGFFIRPRWKVFTKVKDLVTQVESFRHYTRQRGDPESHKEWIETTLARFSDEFDISESERSEERVVKPTKRFADEDFVAPGPSSSKRAFVAEASSESDSDLDFSDDSTEEVTSN